MATIRLELLAQDVLDTNYLNANDCAVTRALVRAGYPTYRHEGTDICDSFTEVKIIDRSNKTFFRLNDVISKMYRAKRDGKYNTIKDKVVILKF